MITIEEKLNIFSKLVLEGERKKTREKVEKMQKHNDETIKIHLDTFRKKADMLVQKRIGEANKKKNEIIAGANVEVKRRILSKKSEFMSRLEKEIEDRAIKFVETNEYEIFLFSLLSRILLEIKEKEKNSLYATEKDLDRYEDKIMNKLDSLQYKSINISFRKLDDSKIGGLILINHDKDVRIDLTIKGILEENKDLIGHMVYSSLEEAGD